MRSFKLKDLKTWSKIHNECLVQNLNWIFLILNSSCFHWTSSLYVIYWTVLKTYPKVLEPLTNKMSVINRQIENKLAGKKKNLKNYLKNFLNKTCGPLPAQSRISSQIVQTAEKSLFSPLFPTSHSATLYSSYQDLNEHSRLD